MSEINTPESATGVRWSIRDLLKSLDVNTIGRQMLELIAELYPICRSITGEGIRETLRHVARRIPLELREVPSGTRVLDWNVPREWNIHDAYIKDSAGNRVVDFARHNLHVVNYSVPVHARLSLSDLRQHLFTLPEHPEWIPYRTSYYSETWGFCLSHNQLCELKDDTYEVYIGSKLADGHLTYGEHVLHGQSNEEVLISTHACHPSLCNDNLSGIALATLLAEHMSKVTRRYTYRFVYVPGTIGSLTWLALNEASVGQIRHGLVLAGVGDAGHPTYKRSRRGNAEIDDAMEHVLRHSGQPYDVQEFLPYGYDERQYCSPGFDLPVGCFSRTPYGQYPEYHTSADNLDFVKPQSLADSFAKCLAVLNVLEHNGRYVNQCPKGEPQLGRRALYTTIGGQPDAKAYQLALLWVLNLSDGEHTLLDVAKRANMPFEVIQRAAEALTRAELLKAL